MQTYSVPRTGDAPLRFRGEQIAEASSSGQGFRQNRWHELALYKLEEGYVVVIGFRTNWQGEGGADLAQRCTDFRELRGVLTAYDPTADYDGFPAGDHYQDKQRRLDSEIKRGYDHAVSELLSEFPEEIDEDPEQHLRQQRDLRRFRRLLDEALSTIKLTVPEAALICDANNGIGSFSLYEESAADADVQSLIPNVADSMALNHSDQKWGVDGKRLVDYLTGLERIQLLAIADAAERWWRLPDSDRDTLADSLSAVGLVR